MSAKKHPKRPTKTEIRRAVASSTAIETGQTISELEQKLKTRSTRKKRYALAG
jgi:hypothetical protein